MKGLCEPGIHESRKRQIQVEKNGLCKSLRNIHTEYVQRKRKKLACSSHMSEGKYVEVSRRSGERWNQAEHRITVEY